MKTLSNPRKRTGATLGLVAALCLILIALGFAFLFMLRLINGAKQVANATDAGVLAAGHQMLSISLSSHQVKKLPILFQALGVDLNTGKIPGLTPDSNGTYGPAPNTTFNLLALNAMGVSTVVIAENAAEEGTPTAISNANALISDYQTAANQLTQQITTSSSQALAVGLLGGENIVNMLGTSSADSFVPNSATYNGLAYTYKSGPADVYFPANSYAAAAIDPAFYNFIQTTSSSTNSANGAPLINGYKAIKIGTQSQGLSNVYLAAVSPTITHLTEPGVSNIPGNSAPPNVVTGSTQAPVTFTANGSSANSGNSNGNSTNNSGHQAGGSSGSRSVIQAIASATIGSTAQFAASIPTGYVVIQNGQDAITVDPSLATVPGFVNLNGQAQQGVVYQLNNVDSIFNEELWTGAGGLGGLFLAGYNPNTGWFYSASPYTGTYNGVFASIDWDPKFGSQPAGYTGGDKEIEAWVAYDNSSGSDPNHHNAALTPSTVLGYSTPTANVRARANGAATQADVLSLAGAATKDCNTYSPAYGPATTEQLTDPCWQSFGIIDSNYYGIGNLNSSAIVGYDYGQFAVGGLTNLEYVKADVATGWLGVVDSAIASNGIWNPNFTFTATAPSKQSGARVYDRDNTIGYACPSNTTNGIMAFGTVATPYDLIQKQVYAYGNVPCSNINDTSASSPWNDITTPLGALLQRCQEIVPSTTASNIIALLQQYPLDLGQTLYIYAGSNGSLVINTSLPPWVSSAGTPDGQPLTACMNDSWNDTIGTVIDSQLLDGTAQPNKAGDCDTHDRPFETSSGTISTQDGMQFVPSSGYNTNGSNLLGVLQFFNSTSGSATFTAPN